MSGAAASQLPLRDIHLPPAVSWWPPAPGWWLLAGVAVFAALSWVMIRRFRRRSPSVGKRALRELEILEQQRSTADPAAYVASLSILVRRTCLSCYPRSRVAGLTGEAWLHFLDDTLGERRFSAGPGRALLDAPYRLSPRVDLDVLHNLCADWIRALQKHPRRNPAPRRRFGRPPSAETQPQGRTS